MMEVSIDRLKRLMDLVREIEQGRTNQERADLWHLIKKDDWEPAFIRNIPNRKPSEKIPFMVELGLGMWAQLLGFNLKDYYQDPLTYAIAQIEMKVFHASHFHDDTFIDKSFRLLIATTLEGSLMGIDYGFTDEGHPWLDYQHPPINSKDDLKATKFPDFYKSGIMPKVHRFYETLNDLLDKDFLVKFPDWIMGPFGVAAEMRGFDRLLIDMVLDPDFVIELFNVIINSRKHWQSELDRFLGIQRTRGLLGNDDVGCPTLSPAFYKKYLLTLEKNLSNYYGGIFYWHSCGKTTRLISNISEIPKLDLFHCGPWTDVGFACQTFSGKGTSLEIMVETVDKVHMADARLQSRYLAEIAERIPSNTNCYIKVDSLEVIRTLDIELHAIKEWINCARDIFG